MTRVELTAAVGLALATVREHKMRSFLTVLGVIIGTGTIIAVGSILAGLDGAVTGRQMLGVERHLAGCAACQQEYQLLRESQRMLVSVGRFPIAAAP